MDYCIIEKWGPNNTLPENCKAVALTVEAIFYLERCGIPYITLEDFYTSYEVRGNADEFLLDQLSWFDDFDRLLKEAFPEADKLGVNLATIYFYPIRRSVGNPILTTRILRKFIESVNPGKIWYIGPKYSVSGIDRPSSSNDFEEHLLDPDFKTGENPYSLLIEPLCNACGIDFQRIEFDAPKKPKRETSILKVSGKGIDSDRVKQLAKKLLPVSDLRSLFICMKSSQTRPVKGRILVLQISGLMEEFCIDARRYGFELFVKGSDGVKKLSWQPWRKSVDIHQFKQKALSFREDILNRILNGDLMHWINRQCGLDVSDILNSRFKYFLYKICPEILTKMRDYIEFYNNNNIDFVVAPNIWTIDEHAAIAAARLTPLTKSIGISHGSDAYECKSRFFFMDRQFDLFFSLSSSEAEHERWLAGKFNHKYPEIYESPYFCRRISKISRGNRRTKSISIADKRRMVLYVPIIYGSRPGRGIELNQPFPMEYVEWHRALAAFFSKRKQELFIWKGRIQSEQNFDLMAEIIREKGYDNIRFESDKLLRWFPFVDRVLFDIPSTAFFEGIYSHMPVLALYRPKYQVLRKDAHECFDSSLRAYNSIGEGLSIVEGFLDGEKEKYIVPFSEPNVFMPEILGTHLNIPNGKEEPLHELIKKEGSTLQK